MLHPTLGEMTPITVGDSGLESFSEAILSKESARDFFDYLKDFHAFDEYPRTLIMDSFLKVDLKAQNYPKKLADRTLRNMLNPLYKLCDENVFGQECLVIQDKFNIYNLF